MTDTHSFDEIKNGPLLRLRHIPAIVICLGLLIAGPLCIVWKQVFINELSIHGKTLSESIIVLNRETAQLRLMVEKLTSTHRIETIAREQLGLGYPSFDQIVIVRIPQSECSFRDMNNSVLNALRRMFVRERQ